MSLKKLREDLLKCNEHDLYYKIEEWLKEEKENIESSLQMYCPESDRGYDYLVGKEAVVDDLLYIFYGGNDG